MIFCSFKTIYTHSKHFWESEQINFDMKYFKCDTLFADLLQF